MATDEVWAETTDGGLLKQLFGYYPTMHDAKIRLIEIDRRGDLARMTLDYRDMAGEDDSQDLAVSIRLEWRGVRSLDFPLNQPDLFGLDFERDGVLITTSLELYPGLFGKIVSEGVEATLLRVDPGEGNEVVWLRMR